MLSIGIVYDHEIIQYMHCVMLLLLLKIAFVISLCCYSLICGIYMNIGIPMADPSIYKYLQDYRKPFSSCKPNEEWPCTYSFTLLQWKWKRIVLYEIVGLWDHIDVFVKCLKLVLGDRFFIRTNHKLREIKVLELMWTQKH